MRRRPSIAASAIHRRVLGWRFAKVGKSAGLARGFWASLKNAVDSLRGSKSLRRHLRQNVQSARAGCKHWQARMHAWCSRRGLHTVDTLPCVGVGVGVDKEVSRRGRCADVREASTAADFTTIVGRWPLRSNLPCLENIFPSCFGQILVCPTGGPR
jgi:hypothetical protein